MSASAFSASSVTVSGLLNTDKKYQIVIPIFQRGYMWKKRHVEEFWEDLLKQDGLRATKGSAAHFFGPIVTLTDTKTEIIEILDGQQRLATATILFSVLRDVARELHQKTGIQKAGDFAARLQDSYIGREDDDGAIVYSLRLGETDSAYFTDTIQVDPPQQDAKTNLRTHRNIKAARDILWEKVTGYTGRIKSDVDALGILAKLRSLKNTLAGDFIMAQIPVESKESAFRIFQTLNHRGLRLSPPDLLLSYLMEVAPAADRRDIRAQWSQMLLRIGGNDIDRFMRHMWISKYGDLKNMDLFVALRDNIRNSKVTSLEFARLCGNECENYVQLINVEKDEIGPAATPFVHALAQELKFQPSFPLLLSAYQLLERKDFANVVKWTLVFITRYRIVSNMDAAGMEDLLYGLARDVRNMMPEPNADSQAAASPERLQMSKRVAQHVKSRLSENSPDDDIVKANVERLDFDDNLSAAKYMLTRLARYQQDPTKVTTLAETNLEHIYPQNPKPNEWGGEEGQKILDPLLWHIGNLTVFGKRANRKAENKEYSIKRPRYAESKVEMAREVATRYDDWNKDTILERARSLAKKVVEVWNFNNATYV